MTIELTREHLLKDEENTSNSKRQLGSSNHPHYGNSEAKIFMPFGRRLSGQSSSSSNESSDTEGGIKRKFQYSTKDDVSNIREDMNCVKETKLFAELPDPKVDNVSPDEYLHKLVYATCGVELEYKKARSMENFFAKVTEEQVAAYTTAVVTACRTDDLDAMKKLHTEDGQILNCFNRFGESLFAMACRRGFVSIVEYLLQSPDVNLRIADDCGRTVLHDACWNPSPQLTICEWIMEREPALFFIADNRGCSPFQYARTEHWGIWRQFLFEKRDLLHALTQQDVKKRLSKA